LLDNIPPFHVGGVRNDSLILRVYNDDPCFAPSGHTVVQTMLKTDYNWWATLGSRYNAEKGTLADLVLEQLAPHFPDLKPAVRIIDMATPLTYWGMARSWRGAFEGWMPRGDSFLGGVSKKLRGLEGFYMAGQWVEPGGGIPVAVLSGRQAVQLLCADTKHTFRAAAESR
jgi:phytoene dehydrogenase-like protein